MMGNMAFASWQIMNLLRYKKDAKLLEQTTIAIGKQDWKKKYFIT